MCRALEIGNPSQALTRLDEDKKITTLISNEGAATGKSKMSFVNEPGLYTFDFGSRACASMDSLMEQILRRRTKMSVVRMVL